MSSSLKLLLLGFLINFAIIEAYDQNATYLYNGCSTNKTFTAHSAYQFNLKTLLSSLSSSATDFYNTTAGSRIINNDTVYGMFMCRGDVALQLCRECVQSASERLSLTCPYSKEAIIWYDQCLLRYSNVSFFSSVSETPTIFMRNVMNITNDLENHTELLAKTLAEVVAEASNSSGSQGTKNFATKSASLSASKTLYVLAQCTPDLSGKDCDMCLRDVMGDIPWCCLVSQGGRLICPSCYMRFEYYQFYDSSSAGALVPNSSANPFPTVPKGKKNNKSRTIIVILLPISVSMILLGFCFYILRKRRKNRYKAALLENFGDESATLESLQFNLGILEAATNKFSQDNRIGKGGFGEVYKGILPDGRDIAVKRLSRSSGQGAVEFKNEVLLIAKLQHINLVTLFGFCLEEQEKILVYEYVPNKSLDHFLFDPQRRKLLNWSERYKIIRGIARGILYLHEHSRLKIIHHDLKPSNILLDSNMNPKISDFGLAKIVATSKSEESTKRIVGTHGYISPEYAMFGQCSEKSDVFSFGVMTLEIISGKRNSTSHESSQDSLSSYAWALWRNETPLEILDPNLSEFYSPTEVTKCIHISLLCVQENPNARPSMAEVVAYLCRHTVELSSPQEPAFFKCTVESSSGQSSVPTSVNEISLSTSFPR